MSVIRMSRLSQRPRLNPANRPTPVPSTTVMTAVTERAQQDVARAGDDQGEHVGPWESVPNQWIRLGAA